ncbi:hypothetical protein LEP1GSC005_3370 [Leptospira santarosai str. ST188]|nr:hypothetical protein LEP1GSC005_3370 [Leptospira santarosai str. ST188]
MVEYTGSFCTKFSFLLQARVLYGTNREEDTYYIQSYSQNFHDF